MRTSGIAAALTLALVACGTTSREGTWSAGGTSPGPSAAPPSRAAALPGRTLPPDDPALKGCAADWAEGFRALAPLVDRADLIVRAHTLSSTTSAERWGTGYRSTVRVDRTLKGQAAATLTIDESACPVVYGGPSDWLLFLSRDLDDATRFQVAGGIQGAFPLVGDAVAPIYRDAYLVRTYAGVTAADLERDVAAVTPIDTDAVARLRELGWSVAGKQQVSTRDLPPASQFGESALPPRYERPFDGYARVASATGLDLRPYGGGQVEELAFYLERSPAAGTTPPSARLIYAGRVFVGGWIQIDATQVFRLDERSRALAATPQPLGTPTSAPNRFPAGVNVVAAYGLATAASAYVKPLDPRMRTAPPAPALPQLLAALDRTFPTEPVPPRQSEGYWVVGFQLAEAYVTFEYFLDRGLLVQRDDGYAIRPGAGFARVIGASP